MQHCRYYAIIFLVIVSSIKAPAQGSNIGIPPIHHYSKKTYLAGTQNWDAVQDHQGVVYWANNEGVLRFDGTNWSLHPVPNQTIVRSVAIDSLGRIFTGAQGELGYFAPSANGVLTYTSLAGKIPGPQRTFEDVWDIVFYGGAVFFRTNHEIFRYRDEKIEVVTEGMDLISMFATRQGLFIQTPEEGLWKYEDGHFNVFMHPPQLQSAITGMLPWDGDTLILTTLKNGLYYLTGRECGKWITAYDVLLSDKRIYTASLLSDGRIALGTSLDGFVILDQQRRVVMHLNKKAGLQNNNILNTFADRDGNLWLGLDNGIDCIHLDYPIRYISPDDELQGTGYTATVYQNRLYLGVSNGAYVAPWRAYYDPESGPMFKRVNGSEGQVWGFIPVGDQLLMGHHEGAFEILESSAHQLSRESGAWTFIPLSSEYLLGGTYTGLSLYHKVSGRWTFVRKLEGIHESCRIMVKDEDGSIWVSHPYRGLYHILWSEQQPEAIKVQFYNVDSGLPSSLNNYVFAIAGKAFFATPKGVYVFNSQQDRFEEDREFKNWLGGSSWVKYLKEDPEGNIWFVTDREAGILLVDDMGLKKSVRKQIFPELSGKLVGGFEHIYPLDDKHVLIGAEQGFLYFNFRQRARSDSTLQFILSTVKAEGEGDSLLYGGGFTLQNESWQQEPAVILSDLNNLSFSYSATNFANPELIEYQVMLEGLEKNWSVWSSETRRNYTALPPGDYIFKARARIRDGVESPIVTYAFRIRPPWYKSKMAWIAYGLSVLGFMAGFYRRQRHRFETEKAQMTETHQQKEAEHLRKVEESKAALSEAQHEKLEVEIKFKNQELAMTTMHLVQKAETLLTVQEALNHILEKSQNPDVKKEIRQLLNLLNFDVKLDEDWEHFAYHFDQVHVDFLKTLREQFPQLSNNDYKLCAYLRMNLSTKEIAPLMNISVRGVEGSRYRLRKKLNLPTDANLTEFILNLGEKARTT